MNNPILNGVIELIHHTKQALIPQAMGSNTTRKDIKKKIKGNIKGWKNKAKVTHASKIAPSSHLYRMRYFIVVGPFDHGTWQ